MGPKPIMMVPGPVPCHADVLKALSAQPLHPRDPKFITIFRRVLQGLRYAFSAPNSQPVLFNGGGLLAMEVACANFVKTSDKVLVLNNGFFGDELVQVMRCYTKKVDVLEAPLGERVSLDAVQQTLNADEFQILAFSHVDTGSGVKAQLQKLAAIAQEQEVITIVDTVASVGGEVLDFDRWGIDVGFASTQKALAGPPGIALLMLSPAAVQHLETQSDSLSSIYLSLPHWITSMQSYETEKIPRLVSTPATNLIAALDVAFQLIEQEGLDQRLHRHEQVASKIRNGVLDLGLVLVPKSGNYYSNTITAAYAPTGIAATSLVEQMVKEGVRIAPGLGKYREEVLRIGHMGIVSSENAEATLLALNRTLKSFQDR